MSGDAHRHPGVPALGRKSRDSGSMRVARRRGHGQRGGMRDARSPAHSTPGTGDRRPERRSSPVVVVVGLPAADAPRQLRTSLPDGGGAAVVLVIGAWMPQLFLDDDRLFEATDMTPNLYEAVAHWLLGEAGLVAGEVRRASVADVIERVGRTSVEHRRVVVVPGRRVRDRVRRAWLLRRLRRQMPRPASATESARPRWSPTPSARW